MVLQKTERENRINSDKFPSEIVVRCFRSKGRSMFHSWGRSCNGTNEVARRSVVGHELSLCRLALACRFAVLPVLPVVNKPPPLLLLHALYSTLRYSALLHSTTRYQTGRCRLIPPTPPAHVPRPMPHARNTCLCRCFHFCLPGFFKRRRGPQHRQRLAAEIVAL